jgi:AraC-like DNA-binding protein
MLQAAAVDLAEEGSAWAQRVGSLVEIPALLREFGARPAEVLTSVGLAPGALDHADNRIPFAAADALLGACVATTGCPHFGLLVGERCHLSHFGALSQLMRNSSTVGEALGALAVHHRLNSDVGAVFLLEHEDSISLGYTIYRGNVRHPGQIYDVAMAITCNLLRELCGPRWAASEVVLSRAKPLDQTPYRRHFRAPLRFDHDHSALRFPAHWQERALPGADPERHRALTAAFEAQHSGVLASRLHRALRLQLLHGKSSGDDLAQTLSLQRRTLSRRLSAQGTSFQKVLDEVRFDVARQLLEHTRAPISEVAAALCYAEVSAFMHAFRRWTGTTPGQWRRTARPATKGTLSSIVNPASGPRMQNVLLR